MAGIDPSASLAARVAAAQNALVEAALNLGAAAEVLQAQLSLGDILAAKILAAQNGQDLLQIAGQTVAAQLPANLYPGQTLLLQVTAFRGNQIIVTNLGVADPERPLPAGVVPSDAAPEGGPPPSSGSQTGLLTTVRIAPPASGVTADTTSNAEPSTGPSVAPKGAAPIAPPPAVFVAASVRAAAGTGAAAIPTPTSSGDPTLERVIAAPLLEARILESRLSALRPAPNSTEPVAAQVSAAPQTTRSGNGPPAQSVPSPLFLGALPQAAARVAQATAAVGRVFNDLLAALGVPQTTVTRAAAALAPQAPARLPAVLERLGQVLPEDSSDPRIPTLRTIIGFIARLEPANEETLPAQISAYVSHVVQGSEPKLQQLLQVRSQSAQWTDAENPSMAQDALVQARAAERGAAMSYDLKSVVLSLLRDPPPGRTPALTAALGETLVTLTGVQLNTLSANAQNPNAIAFSLPLFFRDGGAAAEVRITRDGSSPRSALDADNFHIAFVLETANLGMVAVDMQTKGRSVNIGVKTQRESAIESFSSTLGALKARLEHLHYRVASAAAALASAPVASIAATARTGTQDRERPSNVDMQA